MQGGVYTNKAFQLNLKCVIFAALLMTAYWSIAAVPNPWMMPLIFLVSYVAMAWYDWVYGCRPGLFSGSGYGVAVFDSIFKPGAGPHGAEGGPRPGPGEAPPTMHPNQVGIYSRNVALFHLIAVVPLLAYIGYTGKSANPQVFVLLLGLGLLSGAYHLYRLVGPSPRSSAGNH